MRIRVAHLYPDYLNIYADRGNIAVLARRAAERGHELQVVPVGMGAPLDRDVDFEPLLAELERVVVSGDRAAELALRFAYAGFARGSIEVVPGLEEALDRGLELTPPGGELVVLPTYTAMLALRKIVAARGHVLPYWERAA